MAERAHPLHCEQSYVIIAASVSRFAPRSKCVTVINAQCALRQVWSGTALSTGRVPYAVEKVWEGARRVKFGAHTGTASLLSKYCYKQLGSLSNLRSLHCYSLK